MGNYTIEPVEPLDYNPCFYQPMRKTVTNRCHNIFIPITHKVFLSINRENYNFRVNKNSQVTKEKGKFVLKD